MHLNICSRHKKQMTLQDKKLLARYTGRVQTIAIKHDFFKTLGTFAKNVGLYIVTISQSTCGLTLSVTSPLPGPIII